MLVVPRGHGMIYWISRVRSSGLVEILLGRYTRYTHGEYLTSIQHSEQRGKRNCRTWRAITYEGVEDRSRETVNNHIHILEPKQHEERHQNKEKMGWIQEIALPDFVLHFRFPWEINEDKVKRLDSVYWRLEWSKRFLCGQYKRTQCEDVPILWRSNFRSVGQLVASIWVFTNRTRPMQ